MNIVETYKIVSLIFVFIMMVLPQALSVGIISKYRGILITLRCIAFVNFAICIIWATDSTKEVKIEVTECKRCHLKHYQIVKELMF